jgi:chemotaxis-related protein WspD
MRRVKESDPLSQLHYLFVSSYPTPWCRNATPDYLERWTTFRLRAKSRGRQMQAALVFRIGAEWLALSPTNLQEIAEARPIHSVPPGRSNTLLGLANIRGEFLVCVALERVLGLEKIGLEKPSSKRALYRRMVVAGREDSRFVFPVEEVHGIHWFDPKELKGVPSTVAKAPATYIKGLLLWQNKSVGTLTERSKWREKILRWWQVGRIFASKINKSA